MVLIAILICSLLAMLGTRNIDGYNKKIEKGEYDEDKFLDNPFLSLEEKESGDIPTFNFSRFIGGEIVLLRSEILPLTVTPEKEIPGPPRISGFTFFACSSIPVCDRIAEKILSLRTSKGKVK